MKKNKKGELVPTGPTKKLTENPVPVTDLAQLDKVQQSILSKAKAVEQTDGKLAQKLYNTRQNLLDEIGEIAGKPRSTVLPNSPTNTGPRRWKKCSAKRTKRYC
jgi:hypothetical protein